MSSIPRLKRSKLPPPDEPEFTLVALGVWELVSAALTPGMATPLGSTMTPLAIKSSSPSPPSVMLKVTVLPSKLAGYAYQWGVTSLKVEPYLY